MPKVNHPSREALVPEIQQLGLDYYRSPCAGRHYHTDYGRCGRRTCAKANRPKPRSYEEVFTPEEAKRMGIGGRIDGPGDWNPDPNAAKNVREFIEKGGNADPAGDAIQDGDYHDLLDQNGGPEGF